eukprot:3648555-Rhodomonas_salina.1
MWKVRTPLDNVAGFLAEHVTPPKAWRWMYQIVIHQKVIEQRRMPFPLLIRHYRRPPGIPLPRHREGSIP